MISSISNHNKQFLCLCWCLPCVCNARGLQEGAFILSPPRCVALHGPHHFHKAVHLFTPPPQRHRCRQTIVIAVTHKADCTIHTHNKTTRLVAWLGLAWLEQENILWPCKCFCSVSGRIGALSRPWGRHAIAIEGTKAKRDVTFQSVCSAGCGRVLVLLQHAAQHAHVL